MSIGVSSMQVERSEAEAYYDFERGAPAHVRTALGMAALRVGGGVALSVREDPTQYWSKALGFGFDEPITAELMGRICDFYRSERTPVATFQLAPSVLPPDWDEICAKENITAGSAWAKLTIGVEEALARIERRTPLDPSLRVRPVTSEDAAEWGSVMMRAFGMPGGPMAEMIAASAALPGWHPYAVWQGEEIVATGTGHVYGDTAQFFGGATLPSARRKGAQTALVAAGAKAAHAAGCRWLVTETEAEQPGEHVTSLHNLRRAGFSVLYERRNWLWRP